MSGPWPVNPLTGAAVPPDVDWLISHLTKINSTRRPDERVVRHAFNIRSRLLDLRVRGGGTYHLKGNIKMGFRVGPRRAVRGLANELARLERAARSGSKGRWIKAWAAVSPRCRHLVWNLALPQVVKVKRKFKFGWVVGFRRPSLQHNMVRIGGLLIGPPATEALAAIVQARRSLAAVPPNARRGNQRNDAASALAAAIRLAVFDLTGRVGFTSNRVEDTLRSARRTRFSNRCTFWNSYRLANYDNEIDELHKLVAPTVANYGGPLIN